MQMCRLHSVCRREHCCHKGLVFPHSAQQRKIFAKAGPNGWPIATPSFSQNIVSLKLNSTPAVTFRTSLINDASLIDSG